jgi:hypothetical protein
VELGALQMEQATTQRRFGEVSDGVEEGKGDLLTDDGGGLEEILFRRRQPVDARRQHRLHGGGHLQAVQGFAETSGTRLSEQHAGRRDLPTPGSPMTATTWP